MADKDYSATPLGTKLGAKPGVEVLVFFTTSCAELDGRFPALKKTLAPADGLWVAWPRRRRRSRRTSTSRQCRRSGLPRGSSTTRAPRSTETGRRSASSSARRIDLGSIAGAVSAFNLERLDNGLRILTAPMDSAQSVTCAIMLAAGSRYETPDTNGIAHFAEHMFFKGTERRPTARDISMEIDGIGGEFNAFTGKEYTGYYVKCAAESRDIAFDVLVDMLRHSKFDPDEIDREKGVIIEEMNMYYDTPRDFIGGVYEELLYDDQPLGWDIIGRKETIRDAKRETFNGYVDHWYKPSRMVVGVGGKIGDDLHERVQELLGDMEEAKKEGGPEPVRVQPDDRPRVKVHTKASDQAHICIGVHSYPLEHPDRYALQVLATVLGGGMSSRLFTEVRERRGLAYYVYGLNHSYTDAGSLYAQAGVDINRIDDAVSTVAAELRKIAEEPVPADELEKAKSFSKGRFVLQLETSQGLIMFGLRREVLEGRTPDPEEILEAIGKVTADDVSRVAQDLIARQGLNLAVIGPFDDPARFEKLLA